jgi:hypothetical protein
LDSEQDCKAWVQQYTNTTDIINHYIIDDRVKTCFSFDPRNAEKTPLLGFLHPKDRNENQKRLLSKVKYASCSDLGDYCF